MFYESVSFSLTSSVTPEKIEKASFLELIKTFAVLYTVEKRFTPKESFKIRGRLIDYLFKIEREEKLMHKADLVPD